jgi:hypothetical protein
MSATRDPRPSAAASNSYYYRRRLGVLELLPAIGVGVGAGLAAFYVMRLFLERTPLEPRAGGRKLRRKAMNRDVRRG